MFETNEQWPDEANAAIVELNRQLNYATQAMTQWEGNHNRLADETAAFKKRLTERLHEVAEEQEWCSQFDQEMEDMGLPPRGGWLVKMELRPIIAIEFTVPRDEKYTIDELMHGDYSPTQALEGWVEEHGWKASQTYVYTSEIKREPYDG